MPPTNLLSQTTPEGTTTYDYTNGGQLKLSGTTSYAYDANGNPTSRAGKTVAIGSFNRILDDGNYVYTYDAEGRTTSRRDKQSGVVDRYEWNHASQLTRVASFANASATTATQSVRYGYDAIGRRSSQSRQAGGSTATAVVDYLLSDGDHLAQMVGGDGSIRSRFLHGPEVDMVLAEQTYSSGTAGQPLWQLTDHLGTVRGIAQSQSNGTVSVVNRLRYDAFGKPLSQSDATKQPRFGFAGRDMEPAGGLNYNRHRYYSPDQGRFISQDPIGFAGGDANLYRYVGNKPTMATDPSGLWEWSDNWFTSFTYVAGQAGVGLAQGAANTVNSITNTAASAGNLVISIPNTVANGIDYLAGTPEHQQIRIPNIPTSEWSRGLFTEETDFEHGLSSIAAGTGVQILTGVGAAKLASVPSYASLGSSLLAIDVLENGSNIASGAIDVYQSGSLNSNNGTQILLGSVGVAANFASKIKTKKGATTPAENGVDTPVRTSAPKPGDLFERTFDTTKGPVGLLAEVEVNGTTLHLKDLVIYGQGQTPLTGLTREVLAARSQLMKEAKSMGFEKLRITGERVQSSSSANPGHCIDVTIDLTK